MINNSCPCQPCFEPPPPRPRSPFGGNDAAGRFGRLDSMFYFSQKYRGIDAVFASGMVAPVWATTVGGARRDAGVFAFERIAPEETVLVVLNTSTQESESCAPVAEGGACLRTSLPAGSTLTDVMPGGDGKTFMVRGDGTIAVTVPARSGRVLVRR